MTSYYAHGPNDAGSSSEPLEEHLCLVADRAEGHAAAFGAQEEARLAGVLHDLGKYSELFLKRLRNQESKLDHWSTGAIVALGMFKQHAVAAALAIQGHHIGLQEGALGASSFRLGFDLKALSDPKGHPLQLRLTESNHQTLLDRMQESGVGLPLAPQSSAYDPQAPPASGMLDARMLFSALADADFIETEAHFQGKADGTKAYRPKGPALQPAKALEIVMSYLAELEEKASSSEDVRHMRQDLLDACLTRSESPPGLFTLTAPTGAGKTLAMLAFALKHATVHRHIRRIVMIVPFLSIIDQTASVYRRLLEPHFGSHYVLEHHSLADIQKRNEDKESNRDNEEVARRTARLLAENWDAPLVLTTSVQFFESLFANRPGKCRKLHRLANSVILFDEVQTLPTRIAVPSLAALSRLADRYGCTVVFSTATQPAFDHLNEKVKKYAAGGWRPQPIIHDTQRLFERARRVHICWQIAQSRTWDSIADELAEDRNSRSLCVVNLKRHARELAERVRKRVGPDGLFHLSTSMCPAHRERVLTEVRRRLAPGAQEACRLISTQWHGRVPSGKDSREGIPLSAGWVQRSSGNHSDTHPPQTDWRSGEGSISGRRYRHCRSESVQSVFPHALRPDRRRTPRSRS
ncbi:MAG: CRISPR-associated endonuclease Cas3'' [Candidatus Sumerlaeota bacterium]|nr:CRISPR-associated endonuclease Cas3'' [Candidatus Sumerlaeota bacterium]